MFAKLSVSAAAGLLLGLIALAILRPQTSAGAVLMLLLAIAITTALGTIIASFRQQRS